MTRKPVYLSNFHLLLIGLLLTCLLSTHAEAKSLKQMLFSPGELATAHKKFDDNCDKCHSEFSKAEQTPLCRNCHEQVDKDLRNRRGFHGLNPRIAKVECKSCHSDHKGRNYDVIGLDTDAFPHHLTNFPLKNNHSELSCDQCHSKNKNYRLKAQECVDCHGETDPHQGNMGEDCASCHNSKDWSDTVFDHAKTKFKLTFKHKTVSCKGCHANEIYKETPQQCAACHVTRDIHNGRFKEDCGECHTSEGWKKTGFNHNRDTKFELTHKHLELACNSCHIRPAEQQKLPRTCIGCHDENDTHNASFGKKCGDCHTTRSWAKARFNHDNETKFPLLGRHKPLPCLACHNAQPDNSIKPKATLATRGCIDCHALTDPHEESLGSDCKTCHKESGWNNVRFSHELTTFPLLGMHRQVACDECHLSANYSKADSECGQCHKAESPHNSSLGDECGQCHNPNDWGMWIFNHNERTNYPLKGRHEALQCDLCHQEQLNPSTRCHACHRDNDVHRGAFGQQCQQCHTVEGFGR